MLNLLGVVGSLVKPAIQGQETASILRAENNTVYTDNNVAFVKGLYYVFEPRYVPELWKEWVKTKNVLTGRNPLIKRMRFLSTRTGIDIDQSI